MAENEKRSAYREKAERASKLFRDIRAGKFKWKSPRVMSVKILKSGARYSSDKSLLDEELKD